MAKQKKLTDRERILTRIIDALSTAQLLAPGGRRYEESAFTGHDGHVYAHFAYWREPKAGELVLAKTGGISEWKIGFYVEKLSDAYGGAVIREIGGNLLCNYSNESFVPIVGLHKTDLLEGDQYLTYQKVLAAFRRGDEYCYRFGGVDFEGSEMLVWIREVFGGMGRDSTPFSVRMKWDKRSTIKQILDAMRAGGYGTRSFRPDETGSAA